MFTLILTAAQLETIRQALHHDATACQKLSIFLPDSEWPQRHADVVAMINLIEGGQGNA